MGPPWRLRQTREGSAWARAFRCLTAVASSWLSFGGGWRENFGGNFGVILGS